MRTGHVGGRRSSSTRIRGGRNRFSLEQLERRELLATYTVNATTDTGSGSGLTGDLRYCITQVNKDNSLDTIDFAIGGTGTVKTITLASPLPTIINSVVIDGSSQSGYSNTPVIELDGSKLTALDSVLTVTAGKSTFKALAINGCPGAALTLQGNGLGGGDGNTVVGCFIGTSADGTTAKPNGFAHRRLRIFKQYHRRDGGRCTECDFGKHQPGHQHRRCLDLEQERGSGQ